MKINWRFPNARLCLALILTVGIGFQAGGLGVTTAYALQAADAPAAGEDFEQDPWEPFNEKMFWFNKNVADRFILKPIATGWDFLLPDPVQTGIHNAIDNLSVVRRLVNNLLQLKFGGAGREGAQSRIGHHPSLPARPGARQESDLPLA